MSISIFVSYAFKDKRMWEALRNALAFSGVNKEIQLWDPRIDIVGGQDKQKQIDSHLENAQMFLLLLSPDFFMDAECVQQLRKALELQEQKHNSVYAIPILLRPCLWQRDGLEELEILPHNRVAISRKSDRDAILVDIAQEIHTIIGRIDKSESIDTNAPGTSNPTPSQSNPVPGEPSKQAQPAPDRASVPQNETADVAIVIALKEEFKDLFVDIGASYTPVPDPDANAFYYSFERSSAAANRPYRCVATFVGDMGEVPAALLAQNTLVRWKPATVVLIGLAGALSSNVKLGDVVVADQVDGYLQNAKVNPTADKQGYEFGLSGDVYKTSNRIWNAAQHFEYSMPILFRAWKHRTEEAQLDLFTKQQRYKLLGDDKINEQSQILKGHIASGPLVVAAEIFADWLKQRDRKYMAIEMESMGLMAAVYRQPILRDTLILRAISDDGKEDKSSLDSIGGGAIRRYAMRNAIQLLWSFLDAGILPQHP